MFDARWQQKAFAFIKDKFKPTELVSVIDFSEIYTTFFQDAVQSSYWINTQVTLFPIVVWYKCSCPESPTVREYIVFISDDLKHDYNAVHLFQTIGYGFVCNNRGVRINRIIEFSDGYASQFKSRGPFADISNSIPRISEFQLSVIFSVRAMEKMSVMESVVSSSLQLGGPSPPTAAQ